jgi:hypothetical protein
MSIFSVYPIIRTVVSEATLEAFPVGAVIGLPDKRNEQVPSGQSTPRKNQLVSSPNIQKSILREAVHLEECFPYELTLEIPPKTLLA